MILRKSAFQSKGISLAGMLSNVDIYNLSKPDIHRRAVATNDDILEAFSVLRIGLRILINPKFFAFCDQYARESFSDNTTPVENYSAVLSFWSITRPLGEFSDYVKRAAPTGQTTSRKISVIVLTLLQNQQPGVRTRIHSGRHRRLKRLFVSDHDAHQISGLVRTVSMVASVGLSSDRPVSFVSGILTPADVTANSERENSGGDSLNTKRLPTCWLLPQPKNHHLSG